MGCIFFEANPVQTGISIHANGSERVDLSATGEPRMLFDAALVCGSSVGTWEVLSSQSGILIVDDGEILLVKRNI